MGFSKVLLIVELSIVAADVFFVSSRSSRDKEMTYPWVNQGFDGRGGFLANYKKIQKMERTQWLLLVHVRVQDYLRSNLCAYHISCYILYVYSILRYISSCRLCFLRDANISVSWQYIPKLSALA